MGKPKNAIPGVRVNVYLYPDIAAALKLACADTSFGGIRYGEQTRIVNQALRNYFEGNEACTPPNPLPALTNSAP